MRILGIRWIFFCLALPVPAFCSFGVLHTQTVSAYSEAVAASKKGDYQEAAILFERLENQSPGTTDALLQAGKCYVHLQEFDEAEKALREFVAKDHDSADALYLLGFVLHRENKPQDSLATYTKAAAITPPSGDDLKIVALNYVLLKDYTDAIHWLERAVQMDPRNKEAWYYLGRAYFTQSLPKDARRAFEMALTIDPKDARAENSLGLVYENEGNVEAATSAYRNAIEWQTEGPHSSEQPYLNLGNLYLSEERVDEAIALLQKSVALAPANAQAHLKLGVAYMRKGQLNQARTQLEAAVRLDPSDAPAHYQLGRYYRQVKNIDAAKKEFERVAEIEGQMSDTQTGSVEPR